MEHGSFQDRRRFARQLRQRMTDAESRLWRHLRRRNIEGFKFRRQHPLGPFVADFVCLEARLIVEVDGGQHGERESYDRRREAWLSEQGYRVLRFWNNDVLCETESVLEVIRDALLDAKP
jgi:very-short-patch-repair endonuclease